MEKKGILKLASSKKKASSSLSIDEIIPPALIDQNQKFRAETVTLLKILLAVYFRPCMGRMMKWTGWQLIH
jgi:hypothetical protein